MTASPGEDPLIGEAVAGDRIAERIGRGRDGHDDPGYGSPASGGSEVGCSGSL